MKSQLFNENIPYLKNQNRSLEEVVQKLSDYTFSYGYELIKYNKVSGPRTTYWLIQSLIDLDTQNKHKELILELFNLYFNAYCNKRIRHDDSIWILSKIRVFRLYQEYSKTKILKNKKWEKFYNTLINEVRESFEKKYYKLTLDDEDFESKYYLLYLTYEIDFEYLNDNDKHRKEINRIAREHYLNCASIASSDSLLVNHILFSISIKLLSSYNNLLSGEGSNFLHIKHFSYHIEKLFSSERKVFELRYVQTLKTNPLGLLNLPFEDIYILSPVSFSVSFSKPLNVLENIISYFLNRMAQDSNGNFGIYHEISKHPTKIVPYATFYSIVLLSILKKLVQHNYNDQVIKCFEKYDRESINKNIDLFSRNYFFNGKWSRNGNSFNIVDTEENTYKFITKNILCTDNRGKLKNNTILFFGPPGSGKTTINEYIRWVLHNYNDEKWPIITLNPDLFLINDNYSDILIRVKEIFETILATSNCIFFFDEAEELIHERNETEQRMGRFFTSAMLIFLNKMKESKSVFVFATNFIDSMDKAAIRKGRFSLRKGLGFVNQEEAFDYIKFLYNISGKKIKDDIKQTVIKELGNRKILCKEFFDFTTNNKEELISLVNKNETAELFSNLISGTAIEIASNHDSSLLEFDDSDGPLNKKN